ncbi:MAG: RelA/SpoT family protein [Spiroplasma sp.]|nr:RelA/SpoT family protein [Spiroplasma sp.]
MMTITCKNFNEVFEQAQSYIKNEELLAQIEKAYKYAKVKHQGQLRRNGDPYLYHVLSTAYNLTLWHLDPATIQAGLLHDILEDTPTSVEDLTKEFGQEVATLVSAVTKVSHFAKEKRAEIKSDYLRKLYLSLADDIRVIIIKMADRLHNIRTIEFLEPKKQKVVAKETLEVYASIAHRLGMRELQAELEDRSFAVLYPDEYQKISNLIKKDQDKREQLVDNAIKEIRKTLVKHNKLKFDIYGRSKNIFSIYRKMYYFGKDFNDIHDILAIRIISDSVDNCYAILGYLHQKFTPLPGKFKDYIATPKNNMYQSLHTSIVFKNEIYELQIRTAEMEYYAMVGAAAHWRYKEGEEVSPKKKQAEIDEKLNIFQTILDLNTINKYQDNDENNVVNSNLETEIKQDLFSELIYVLTPNGKVVTLPLGSTILDFAYKIHTQIGETAMGARVNGVYSALNTVLKTGDVVEIKTAKTVKPNYDWLTIAKTNFARHKIKKYLNQTTIKPEIKTKSDNEKKIANIKEQIEKYIQEHKLRWRIANSSVIYQRLKILKYQNYDDFCLAIAGGAYSVEEAVKEILFKDSLKFKDFKAKKNLTPTNTNAFNDAIVENAPTIKTQLARCCLPIPDEAIIGYISKGQGIKVHRPICPNILNETKKEKKGRTLITTWNLPATIKRTYESAIKIYYLDRPGLLADIINLLNHLKVPIQMIDANNRLINHKGVLKVIIKVPGIDRLHQITSSLKKVPDIIEITRIIM